MERRRWYEVGRARVAYLNPGSLSDLAWALREVRNIRPSVMYLNSYMSPFCGILPLLSRRIGLTPFRVLMAPRGELSRVALSIKPRKKIAYRFMARLFRLHSGVVFQASTSMEASDTQSLHPECRVLTSANRIRRDGPPSTSVPPGCVRLAHISRVSPIKNLHTVIGALGFVSTPVRLDIWGPIEDSSYWQKCQRAAFRASAAGRGRISRAGGTVEGPGNVVGLPRTCLVFTV